MASCKWSSMQGMFGFVARNAWLSDIREVNHINTFRWVRFLFQWNFLINSTYIIPNHSSTSKGKKKAWYNLTFSMCEEKPPQKLWSLLQNWTHMVQQDRESIIAHKLGIHWFQISTRKIISREESWLWLLRSFRHHFVSSVNRCPYCEFSLKHINYSSLMLKPTNDWYNRLSYIKVHWFFQGQVISARL